MPDTAIFSLRTSLPRCLFGVGVLGALGGLLFAIAIAAPPADTVWLVFFLLAGALSVWAAWGLAQRVRDGLVLTGEGLFALNGQCLCRIDEIRAVERGFGTFKPSGGFLIRLRAPGPRIWVPGLWWRLGRTIGVGGVFRAGELRALAEILQGICAERERD